MTNTELVHRWFDGLWNRGNEAIIDEIMATDCRAHGLGAEDIVGPDAFRQFYHSFRASFPTVHIDIEEVLDGGDRVAVRARVEVFDHAGRGPFHFTGGGFIRIENERFVEAWNEWNFLNLLTEMGAIPADAMEVALVQAAAVPT
jgi:predicted SnoaL-like aldol condensation-catalyzing enzyme